MLEQWRMEECSGYSDGGITGSTKKYQTTLTAEVEDE